MSATFAAASGALLVCAAWEGLGALMRLPLLDLMARWTGPARHAGRGGRASADAEGRRLQGAAIMTLGAAGWLVAGPAAAALMAIAAPAAAGALIRARGRRWQRAAEHDVVPAARALADALAAGHPLARAIDVAASDGALNGPGRVLLGQTSRRLRLGAPLDEALGAMARRAGSPAWASLTSAILVQRETGGDLARLLRDLAAGAESGARVEREARAASAQARLTARIVLALPLLAFGLAELAAPGTSSAMLAEPLARLLAGTALVCQLAALVAVRRIARVEG